MNDPQTYTRYITKGNVLSYNGTKKAGTLNNATNTQTGAQLKEEELKYQNMWYALNRKMIISYDLLNEKVMDHDDKTKVNHNEKKPDRSVFDNLVNETGLKQYINGHVTSSEQGYNVSLFDAGSENENLTAVMVDNEGKSAYHITADKIANLRLLLCTGDVEIEPGVKFSGIIMAKGKITLGAGAQLISAPLEAAKVFQAQSETDNVSPKNFFWEGDKYVLGNSQTTDNNSSDIASKLSNTYDLAECVTYENWKKK